MLIGNTTKQLGDTIYYLFDRHMKLLLKSADYTKIKEFYLRKHGAENFFKIIKGQEVDVKLY